MTCQSERASWRQIAAPISLLPPLTSTRFMRSRLQHHRQAPAQQLALPGLDRECVQQAWTVRHQPIGAHGERSRDVVQARHVQLDLAHAREQAPYGLARRIASEQRAMRGERLGGIFDACHCGQRTVAAQWVVRGAMAHCAAHDAVRIALHDLLQQAHRSTMRHQPGDIRGHQGRTSTTRWLDPL